MGALSLCRSTEEVLPAEIDGCEIDADFKTILFIQWLLTENDGELWQAVEDAAYWFYVDERPEDYASKMFSFIRAGEEPEQSDEPQQMDFEFDADEIYSDFLDFYGIDLLTAEMHWYKFLALFTGIMRREGALSSKIQTRFMKTDGLKGKDLSDALRAKKRAQIPVKLTLEETQEAQEFADEWQNIGL